MRKAALAGMLLVAALLPQRVLAWGTAGHRLITARAIELLPQELKPFFEQHRNEILVRVMDPDTWRNAGWEEDGNHFVNFGVPEYGKYPFTELPRDYDRAVEKFGAAAVKRNGTLPWREEEEFGNLRRAFAAIAQGRGYGGGNVVLFAAWMSHYVQDAYQPFHATNNYDGAQTGNNGIHARFETELIDRFQAKLALAPAVPKPITTPRDTSFDVLVSSHQLVPQLLQADKEAVAGKAEYDDPYFQKLFDRVKPLLERQLSEAVTATAGLIVGAWEQAGRPSLVQPAARAPQRVRTPRR